MSGTVNRSLYFIHLKTMLKHDLVTDCTIPGRIDAMKRGPLAKPQMSLMA